MNFSSFGHRNSTTIKIFFFWCKSRLPSYFKFAIILP
nr:MAG TPA: hypothetical protein [Caudoviricetes sp.]